MVTRNDKDNVRTTDFTDQTDRLAIFCSSAEAEGAVTTPGCLWCGKHFKSRRDGSPRVFCAPSCRVAYHSACRRWAEKAIATGKLTVAALRNGDAAACTLLPGGETPVTRACC